MNARREFSFSIGNALKEVENSLNDTCDGFSKKVVGDLLAFEVFALFG
jgi:hypothetical protein